MNRYKARGPLRLIYVLTAIIAASLAIPSTAGAATIAYCYDAVGNLTQVLPCATGQVCADNACCSPTTCLAQGKNCGSISDGCGGTLQCGSCVAPRSCGGGGTPNVCGCTTETNAAFCTRLGKNCGQVSGTDNCGASRTVASCGTCTPPQYCGGGGTVYVCGCKAETDATFCARLGKNCGQVTGIDNCGSTRTVTSCGACTAPQSCGGGGTANLCGCTKETDAAFCSRLGKNCGQVSGTDNCGFPRTVATCGSCTAPQSCGGGGTANRCGCRPITCDGECGDIPNGCGGTLHCGTCGACFVAGTPITMADGSAKPIEAVTAGDLVLSYDTQKGMLVQATVERALVHPGTPVLLRINGDLTTTPEHRFLVDGAWTRADQLRIGDRLLRAQPSIAADGSPTIHMQVTQLEELPGGVTTYNFEVAVYHDYFAGGVLVHNIKAVP